MNLWIFGDSYVQTSDKVEGSWVQLLAQELNANLRDLSHFGSALEFAYYRFNIARKKIEKNDIIIITLTDSSHRWFFKHFPAAAVSRKSPNNNKQETKAIELYYQYLEHKEIQETYLIDFLYNVTELAEKKNLKVIVLPVFDDTTNYISNIKNQFPLLSFPTGNLFNISYRELKDSLKKIDSKFTTNGNDIRFNHMSKSNHIILKDKILDYIKNNSYIDLTHGFVEDILDLEIIKIQEFIDNELFGCKVKSL